YYICVDPRRLVIFSHRHGFICQKNYRLAYETSNDERFDDSSITTGDEPSSAYTRMDSSFRSRQSIRCNGLSSYVKKSRNPNKYESKRQLLRQCMYRIVS